MKTRVMSIAMLLILVFAFAAAPVSSVHAQKAGVAVPVTGTATNALGEVVNFAGQYNITRFAVQNGQLVAVGSLTGTLTNTVTGAVQDVTQAVTIPVAATGTCDVLHLTLGPLDLDLLGLQVHLDQVVLNIDAQSGSGNLLGNLLCAVAGLLDNGGPLVGISNLLNQILGIL